MQSEANELGCGAPAAEVLTIDITPVGCTTPEGNAKVAKAIKDFDDTSAALANTATEFFDTHESDILHAMEMYPGVAEDVRAAGLEPHPAILPAAVARFGIQLATDPGEVVYDPMCGSGTVAVEAMKLGRKAIDRKSTRL